MVKFARIITETMAHNDIEKQQTATEGQFIDDIKKLLEAARNLTLTVKKSLSS